ncbi:MAG TPA: hypothetical protein ENO11_03225 [Desulfobacteraceae bacterium]|nr:hypothetical protein [Desulfobacteraceae bacterium]
MQRIRYMVPLLPFVALMSAYGLVALQEIQIRRFCGCMIVSSSFAILYVVYLPFLHTTSMMNIKMAGEALNDLGDKIVNVTVLPQENSEGSTFIAIPLLDLFTEKQIISRQRWPQAKPDHLSAHSPLLFTWTLDKPSYYKIHEDKAPSPRILAIISSGNISDEDYSHLPDTRWSTDVKHFTRHSGAFRYRTMVSVYN